MFVYAESLRLGFYKSCILDICYCLEMLDRHLLSGCVGNMPEIAERVRMSDKDEAADVAKCSWCECSHRKLGFC